MVFLEGKERHNQGGKWGWGWGGAWPGRCPECLWFCVVRFASIGVSEINTIMLGFSELARLERGQEQVDDEEEEEGPTEPGFAALWLADPGPAVFPR